MCIAKKYCLSIFEKETLNNFFLIYKIKIFIIPRWQEWAILPMGVMQSSWQVNNVIKAETAPFVTTKLKAFFLCTQWFFFHTKSLVCLFHQQKDFLISFLALFRAILQINDDFQTEIAKYMLPPCLYKLFNVFGKIVKIHRSYL